MAKCGCLTSQRMTALLCDSKVLRLDEATSALDTGSEKVAQDKAREGRSAISPPDYSMHVLHLYSSLLGNVCWLLTLSFYSQYECACNNIIMSVVHVPTSTIIITMMKYV